MEVYGSVKNLIVGRRRGPRAGYFFGANVCTPHFSYFVLHHRSHHTVTLAPALAINGHQLTAVVRHTGGRDSRLAALHCSVEKCWII